MMDMWDHLVSVVLIQNRLSLLLYISDPFISVTAETTYRISYRLMVKQKHMEIIVSVKLNRVDTLAVKLLKNVFYTTQIVTFKINYFFHQSPITHSATK